MNKNPVGLNKFHIQDESKANLTSVYLPDVVLEGVGILFAPFLLDLLTYDLEAVKEALGIFNKRSKQKKT